VAAGLKAAGSTTLDDKVVVAQVTASSTDLSVKYVRIK